MFAPTAKVTRHGKLHGARHDLSRFPQLDFIYSKKSGANTYKE
jgi:hypothetical protein